jgi:hypothetical protein
MAQGVGPEFKPQYHKNKNKKITHNSQRRGKPYHAWLHGKQQHKVKEMGVRSTRASAA